MQVAVDSNAIPPIHHHGPWRRVLVLLLVLLHLDQNVTALILGRTKVVTARLRVERLLLRMHIIKVKLRVIACSAGVSYLKVQVILVVVVVGLLRRGRTTIEHDIRILLLKRTDLAVGCGVLRQPVPIIEEQTLSLLLES